MASSVTKFDAQAIMRMYKDRIRVAQIRAADEIVRRWSELVKQGKRPDGTEQQSNTPRVERWKEKHLPQNVPLIGVEQRLASRAGYVVTPTPDGISISFHPDLAEIVIPRLRDLGYEFAEVTPEIEDLYQQELDREGVELTQDIKRSEQGVDLGVTFKGLFG